MEQCSFTGGSFRCEAMSEFLIVLHSSRLLPLSHSVVKEDDAIAEPQPKVCRGGRWVIGGARPSRCSAEGAGGEHLEDGLLNLAVLADLHLQPHHVAARRSTDQARAHAGVGLVE